MTSEVEWRRQWKPDLRAQPWKPLTLGEEKILIKSNFTESSYELLVTNMICLWYEEVELDGVKNRTKKLNPGVEAPVGKILDHIRDSLDAVDVRAGDIKLTGSYKNLADSDEQKLLLTLTTKLAGLPFVWKFQTFPADSKMVSDHLTVPLLAMVGELSRRQKELYKILKNKDKEIDDLRSQGVKVSRKHLETGIFDETIFKHTMTTSKGFTSQVHAECTEAFDEGGQDLYRDLMTKHAYINRPDSRDDEEGETFADDGASGDAAPGGSTVQSWSNRLPPSLATGSVSPRKSPTKSPKRGAGSNNVSPTKGTDLQKESEIQRRQELQMRLQQEEQKKEQKKKKKKMKF